MFVSRVGIRNPPSPVTEKTGARVITRGIVRVFR